MWGRIVLCHWSWPCETYYHSRSETLIRIFILIKLDKIYQQLTFWFIYSMTSSTLELALLNYSCINIIYTIIHPQIYRILNLLRILLMLGEMKIIQISVTVNETRILIENIAMTLYIANDTRSHYSSIIPEII